MAFRMHDRKVYFALETTEGTRVAPNASTGYVQSIDPTFTVTNRMYERNPTRLAVTPVMQITPGTGRSSGAPSATIEFSFSVEMAGSGTLGTAPRWSSLLKACGMKEVAVGSNALTGIMLGGTAARFMRNYENFSAQAGTAYASGTQTGRVIGDTAYDDTTLYYKLDDSGSTAIANGNNLVGQSSGVYGEASGTSTATGGLAYVMTSGTALGGEARAGADDSSLTIQMVVNSSGDYIEGVGCRGNVEFAFTSGDSVKMNFTFTGRLNQYAEGGTFTPTADTEDIPPAFTGVSLGIAESTYGASDVSAYTSTIFNTMNVNISNEITVRENVDTSSGYDVAFITGRSPSMTFNPDAVRVATAGNNADFWDRFLSGETTRARLTVGSDAGNSFLFRMPACQFTGVTDGNRDEVMVLDSTTTLTGGDYGSSVQDRTDGADSTTTNERLGTDNEFVFYAL